MIPTLKEAIKLHQANLLDQAEESYLQILKNNPNVSETFQLLGTLYLQKNNLEKSEEYLLKYLKVNSKSSLALNNLGILKKKIKNYEKAEYFFKKNIKINNHWDSRVNLGNLYLEIKDFKNSLTVFHNLSIEKKDSKVLSGLALSYFMNGKVPDAIHLFESLINENLYNSDCLFNYAFCLNKLKKYKESISILNKLIFLEPSYLRAYLIRADSFLNLRQMKSCENDLNAAIKLNGESLEVLTALVEFLKREGRFDEIVQILKNIDFDSKENFFLLGLFLHAKLKFCDWNNLSSIQHKATKLANTNENIMDPIHLKYINDDPEAHLKVARHFWKEKFNFFKYELEINSSSEANSKIKIGYFSGDFGDHAVSHQVKELLINYNKNLFEVYCFSSYKRNDELNTEIRNSVDQFIDLHEMGDNEIIKLVSQYNLDIGVDLAGFTENSMSQLFNFNLAKVKINYQGFPGTLGNEHHDFIMCDPFVIPPEHKNFYDEKLLYIEDCYADISDVHNLPSTNRKEFNLPIDAILIGALNRPEKILPEIFSIWMSAISKCDKAYLAMAISSDVTKKNLENFCNQNQFEFKKIIFLDRVPNREDYLSRISHFDFSLDTHPYNGHTISLDNLKSLTPVLTLCGNSYASRVTYSLLKNLELDDFVAHNLREYEDKIVHFCTHLNEVNLARNKLKTFFQKKIKLKKNLVSRIEDKYLEIIKEHEKK